MPQSSRDPSVAHFGTDGMRRISLSGSYGIRMPGTVRQALEDVGVPLHVAPYFIAARETDGLTLGAFAGHHGLSMPDERAGWVRIGTDRLAHLAVRPDGAVQAVFADGSGDDMFASSDLSVFNASLAALDRRMPVIAASTSLPEAAAAFRELNAELRQIDPDAFEDRESWWPRVLDDIRHTLNFPFSSAFEYLDGAGNKQIATEMTGPGKAHPEELLWQRLRAEGIDAKQVRRVYCELEPCMMPGHYCAVWLQAVFPHAEFTHSFDYGSTADSREAGLKELMTHAAQQAGNP
ncbi:nucleic acid/nucleotide deaminase domain-containing protein [Streptomyces sp. NPDC058676]|uniref:nucleic acid/nucleotide deaminase domain-containing protein n=1 Tax=unclassified Streptomyces TaxID=2593676 RepID=UPI00365AB43E